MHCWKFKRLTLLSRQYSLSGQKRESLSWKQLERIIKLPIPIAVPVWQKIRLGVNAGRNFDQLGAFAARFVRRRTDCTKRSCSLKKADKVCLKSGFVLKSPCFLEQNQRNGHLALTFFVRENHVKNFVHFSEIFAALGVFTKRSAE